MKIGDIVKYANYEWYVIKVGKRNITLLAKNDFGKHRFDTSYNTYDYETSEIRAYLNSTILRSIKDAGGDPLPVDLSDVGVTDKVWLISRKEAKSLPSRVRATGNWDWYWLRSPGCYIYNASYVYNVGVYTYGYDIDNDSGNVRPAIRIKAEELSKDNKI